MNPALIMEGARTGFDAVSSLFGGDDSPWDQTRLSRLVDYIEQLRKQPGLDVGRSTDLAMTELQPQMQEFARGASKRLGLDSGAAYSQIAGNQLSTRAGLLRSFIEEANRMDWAKKLEILNYMTQIARK